MLDGVDLDLHPGEVHVLLGENGAGKSTLAKILSGAHQKSSGQILLHGRSVEINSPRDAEQLGIAIVYQELNLVPTLTVLENLVLGREPATCGGVISLPKSRLAAQGMLERISASIPLDRQVRELGIAERQMVEIAKALSRDARVIILDEPTSALTQAEIRQLFSFIQQLKKRGFAIIYISHRLEELLEIGDRVTVLRDGRAVATRPVAGVTMAELVRLMVDRDLKDQFPRKRVTPGTEVLRVENLNQRPYLTDINFHVREGEIVGIAGLAGSGRSRLARALFGAERLDAGTIRLRGKLENVSSPRRAIDLGIGYLSEDRRQHGLILKLCVSENITLPFLRRFCRYGVLDRGLEAAVARDFSGQLKIRSLTPNPPVSTLSGGNQQKVVLSKWLGSKAKLFIFDEPTRGIDVGAKVEIYELMNCLTAEGAAILMVSSEMPEVLGMSDRILTMCRGTITGEFLPAQASQVKLLQSALGLN